MNNIEHRWVKRKTRKPLRQNEEENHWGSYVKLESCEKERAQKNIPKSKWEYTIKSINNVT